MNYWERAKRILTEIEETPLDLKDRILDLRSSVGDVGVKLLMDTLQRHILHGADVVRTFSDVISEFEKHPGQAAVWRAAIELGSSSGLEKKED